ncbi:hypothetical protein ABH19_02500 [Leptospirillum sp. Group II 'CF-1']|nr:hypothetical protein ABH19_02500 [Leptospirillum sp. Group II 'CF-1']
MHPLSHQLPKFIWGEAITSRAGSEFEDCEYLTHTSFPRFVCRIVPLEHCAGNDGSIRVWREGPEGDPVWKTNFGFLARDFLWINWPDNDEVVAGVMREICVDRRLREELYEGMD